MAEMQRLPTSPSSNEARVPPEAEWMLVWNSSYKYNAANDPSPATPKAFAAALLGVAAIVIYGCEVRR
jgi:hypothetical protein